MGRPHIGRVGQSATLKCSLTPPDDDNFSVEWRREGKLVYSAYGSEVGHAAPHMQGRLARSSALDLTVHELVSADAGSWQCALTRFSHKPSGVERGAPVKLVVQIPPSISSPPSQHVVYRQPGDALHISCEADGWPRPEITWMRNGRIASTSEVLRVDQLSEASRGEYTCVAANAEGSANATMHVQFARNTILDFVPENKTVAAGSRLFWHCHGVAYPDRVTYRWLREGKPVQTTQVGLRADIKEGELSIREVSREDRGWFTCEAGNGHGDTAHAKAYLDVQYPPDFLATNRQIYTVAYGHNVTLTCQTDANPRASRVNWTHNGKLMTHHVKEHLRIAHAHDSDSGVYACQAFNPVGKSSLLEMHVVVAEAPIFTRRPPPVMNAQAGDDLEINCEGFGDPAPVQYWTRNGRRYPTHQLRLSQVTADDHGEYTCIVSNSIATIKADVTVVVQNTRPQPAEISDVRCIGENSFDVHWQPGYTTLPQSHVLHYANERGDWSSLNTAHNRVTLADLTRFNNYRFVVESRNAMGAVNSTAVEKRVCSMLPSPSSVRLQGSSVEWASVEDARSYQVEYRAADEQTFTKLAEVLHPSYSLQNARLPIVDSIDVRVRAARPYYSLSEPSATLSFRITENSDPSLALAIFGGLAFFFFFLVLYFFGRRKGKKPNRHQQTEDEQEKHYDEYICQASRKQHEAVYEQSVRGTGSSQSGSARWPHPEEDCLIAYDYDDLQLETSRAVDDMWRDAYIYRGETSVADQLRIEQLRREWREQV